MPIDKVVLSMLYSNSMIDRMHVIYKQIEYELFFLELATKT